MLRLYSGDLDCRTKKEPEEKKERKNITSLHPKLFGEGKELRMLTSREKVMGR